VDSGTARKVSRGRAIGFRVGVAWHQARQELLDRREISS
jgi:hypothetical protein